MDFLSFEYFAKTFLFLNFSSGRTTNTKYCWHDFKVPETNLDFC